MIKNQITQKKVSPHHNKRQRAQLT